MVRIALGDLLEVWERVQVGVERTLAATPSPDPWDAEVAELSREALRSYRAEINKHPECLRDLPPLDVELPPPFDFDKAYTLQREWSKRYGAWLPQEILRAAELLPMVPRWQQTFEQILERAARERRLADQALRLGSI